ncbi:P-loop containing nucleoside triphosphate hydrolase protein [Obelidium mucronatum]|nr:P-loop containing nucleoside triphosphate hydrolase protein [Obelidium mucronatum]
MSKLLIETLSTWFYKTPYAGGISALLIVLAAVDGMLQPLRNYLLGQFVDVLTLGTGSIQLMTAHAIILSLLTLIIGSIQQTAWSSVLHDAVGLQLRHRLTTSILITATPNPNLAQTLQNIQSVQKIAQEHIPAMIQCLILFFTGLAIALATSIKLSLAILLSFPLVAIILSRMWVTNRRNDISSNLAVTAASSLANELLTNVETVLSMNMQSSELKRYKDLLMRCLDIQKQNAVVNGVGWGTYHCTMFMAFAVAFWVGGSLVNEGVLSAGGVLVCFSQLAVGITALGNIGSHIQALKEAEVLLNGALKEDEKEVMTLNSGLAKLDHVEGRIEFRNVTFSYPSRPENLILDGFNLIVEVGGFTAIVAESGAGKSTIFALLLRLYTPNKGQILLDGIDIQTLDPIWLRSQFATVDQQTHLFESMTLYENLTLGCPFEDNIAMEDVHKALDMAHAKKLWTTVGGVNDGFSGGQRQRFGVARAFVGSERKQFVLLDEPTSALDAESEEYVQKGLKVLCDRKTTLLITHRIDILKEGVSHIVVLENGRIVESGSYQKLTSDQSRFNKLFDIERSKSSNASLIPSVVGKTLNRADETRNIAETDHATLLDWSRLWKITRPQAKWIIMGAVGSLLEGLIFPAEGFLISCVVTSYSLPHDIQFQKTAKYSLGLVFLGLFAFVCCCLTGIGNTYSQCTLIAGLKLQILTKALEQNLDFFDEANHSVGEMELVLLDGVKFLETVPGPFVANVGKVCINISVGICVALYYAPKLTFGVLLCVPVVILLGKLTSIIVNHFHTPSIKTAEQSTLFLLAVLPHVRTIVLLNGQTRILSRFATTEAVARKDAFSYTVSMSLFGQPLRDALIILLSTAGMRIGVSLIRSGVVEPQEMLIALTTLVLSAVDGVGVVSSLAGGGGLRLAARRFGKVLDILDYKSSDSSESVEELQFESPAVEFYDVNYEYLSRKGVSVLDGYNLKVISGTVHLLTGKSGSGKSTVIQLLQKLRTPNSGTIKLFGRDISILDTTFVRTNVVTVTQSSRIFQRSIQENIALLDDAVNLHAVEQASKLAGAHDFIMNLSDGYETVVGSGPKESLLSEGQKQRICLARAILRDPRVLVLDEATSGLDGESEKLVVEGIRKWLRADSRRVVLVSTHTPTAWKDVVT